GDDSAQRKAGVVERSPEEPFVCGYVRPDPDDLDPVHRFPLPQLVAVARKDPAGRKIRNVREHCHLVPGRRPGSRVLVGPRGGGVRFGREIVAQEQDFQMAWAAADTVNVTRATSTTSTRGIGEALPSRIADRNAETQARCPLSCLHDLA